ncbi:MAG: hypothetical protein NC822_04535 [Candidatus Omnitrophica bacterium]|nr:hypothetical protein [Candidatus Omnitrophota bacterium]
MWYIEVGFKELKQDIEVNPIYHWTERKIISHIFVSLLTLLLKIALKKNPTNDKETSYQDVFETVCQIKAGKLT